MKENSELMAVSILSLWNSWYLCLEFNWHLCVQWKFLSFEARKKTLTCSRIMLQCNMFTLKSLSIIIVELNWNGIVHFIIVQVVNLIPWKTVLSTVVLYIMGNVLLSLCRSYRVIVGGNLGREPYLWLKLYPPG